MLGDRQLPTHMRSKPARQIEKHRQRRRQLRQDHREAQLSLRAAEREQEEARAALEAAESRALAFGTDGANSTHRKRVDAAGKALDEAAAREARVAGAIGMVDEEIRAVARDNYPVLRDEIIGAHDEANRRMATALAAAETEFDNLREARIALQDVMHAAGTDFANSARLADQPRNLRAVIEHGLPWPLVHDTAPEPAGPPAAPAARAWMSGVNQDT